MSLALPSIEANSLAGELYPPTRVRYGVLMLLGLAAAIAYLQRFSMAVANEPIQHELGLDKIQVGWMMSAFFIGYSIMQVPSGWMADRWGSRRTLTACAAAWSTAGTLVGLTGRFETLFVLWLLAGAAQAGVFPCATSSIGHWFPSTRRAVAIGTMSAFMQAGAALSPPVTRALVAYGWREALVALSLPGIAWAAFFYYWFRDRPSAHRRVNPGELELIGGGLAAAGPQPSAPHVAASTPWRGLLTSPTMWLIGTQQFFRAAAYIFLGTWFIRFLENSRGMSETLASSLASLPLIGVTLSGPLGGWISDWLLERYGSRRVARQAFSVASLFLAASLFVAVYFVRSAIWTVAAISFASFFAGLPGVCAYAVTIDMGGRNVGTVFSLMNMCGNIGAAASPVYVGWLVEQTGNWDQLALISAGAYLVSSLSWVLLNPEGVLVAEGS